MFFENHAELLTSVKKMLVEITSVGPSTTFCLSYTLCKGSARICMFADTPHTAPSPWWWGIAQTVALPVIIYTTAVQESHKNCSANLPPTEQFLWWWGRCNLGSLTLYSQLQEQIGDETLFQGQFSAARSADPSCPCPSLVAICFSRLQEMLWRTFHQSYPTFYCCVWMPDGCQIAKYLLISLM